MNRDLIDTGATRRLINFPRPFEIALIDLHPHPANGVRVEPIHLHGMLILNESLHPASLQPGSQQMRLLGLTHSGNGDHYNSSQDRLHMIDSMPVPAQA